MKDSSSFPSLKLPAISKTINRAVPTKKVCLKVEEESLYEEDQYNQINELDNWTARKSQNPTKSKGSKIINMLYRSSTKRNTKRQYTESSMLIEAKLFLLRLDEELKKGQEINYSSIYRNIQYCSSVYQNFYQVLLKTINKQKTLLTERYVLIQQSLQRQRADHIKNMAQSQSYKEQIPVIRLALETKEEELYPIKIVIQRLEKAKIAVLKHNLNLGYDVREDGIIWILRELGYMPKNQEFPSFLNERQLQYFRVKLSKELPHQKDQIQIKQNLQTTFNKSSEQIYQIVTRKKKRQLSMIKQGAILQQLNLSHNQTFSPEKHHYINEGVLAMAQKEFPKTKSTKYEIIYKETLKKLNKYCVNEIYKNNIKKQKDSVEPKRNSLNTLQILSHFETKIEDFLRKSANNDALKDQQQKELDEIIRSLRYESYQFPGVGDRSGRNPVSIICCLVGWRKAKRIIQQQLNHLF